MRVCAPASAQPPRRPAQSLAAPLGSRDHISTCHSEPDIHPPQHTQTPLSSERPAAAQAALARTQTESSILEVLERFASFDTEVTAAEEIRRASISLAMSPLAAAALAAAAAGGGSASGSGSGSFGGGPGGAPDAAWQGWPLLGRPGSPRALALGAGGGLDGLALAGGGVPPSPPSLSRALGQRRWEGS